MKNDIIYGLIDPRTQELRYIGKSETGVQRFKEHLKASSLKRDTRKDRWIKVLLALGLKPELIVIEEFDSPEQLFEAEEFWYEYYVGLGANLTNSTKCGKGTRGYKHKEETIQLFKESALKRDKSPYANPANKREIQILDGEEFLDCSRCEETKLTVQFSKLKSSSWYDRYCKACRRAEYYAWKKANPAPKLSKEDYNASRVAGGKAGGLAIKNSPELRKIIAMKRSKAIQGVNVSTGEIVTFPSALAAKEAGFQNSNLGQAIKYNRPYKGYVWSFI